MNSRVFVGGIVLAVGSVAFVCSAQAADLPPARMPAAVAPIAYAPPVYNWTGFYIGGNIGGGLPTPDGAIRSGGSRNTFNDNGFIGGGQLGYNVQYNALVLGVEGDFDWTGLKGSGTDLFGNSINTKTEWTSTATGRIGVAFHRFLV